METLANSQEGLPLTVFSALTVAYVQRGSIVVTGRERGAHAGIHASAEKNNRALG
jgi:hypothetical protein